MPSSALKKISLLTILAFLVAAALAVATLAAPTPAQAASNPSKVCSEQGDTIFGFPGEPPVTHGACTSFKASGTLTKAAYSAQCKNLAAEFGGYPFTFYEPFPPYEFPVKNQGECIATLSYLHSLPHGEE